MRSYKLNLFIDQEAKSVIFKIDNLFAGDLRISKTYDITGDEKKQRSLLRLLQSEHVKYSRFHGVQKGWCSVPKEYIEHLIEIKNERSK
jgi:hypothetical protein